MYITTVSLYNLLIMELDNIRKFRSQLRSFQRELAIQNSGVICCGVTIAQCHTLMELQQKEKQSINDLAAMLNLDKSTVSRTIEGLVNLDLVDRFVPKENRRLTLLSLTERGIQICKSINNVNDQYSKELLQNLSVSEQENFTSIFEKLIAGMHKINKKNEK